MVLLAFRFKPFLASKILFDIIPIQLQGLILHRELRFIFFVMLPRSVNIGGQDSGTSYARLKRNRWGFIQFQMIAGHFPVGHIGYNKQPAIAQDRVSVNRFVRGAGLGVKLRSFRQQMVDRPFRRP